MVNGKASIKDENAECLKQAADACPRQAIIIDGNYASQAGNETFGGGFGMGRGRGGQGRGMGRGQGRGRGMGRGRVS